MLSKNDKFLLIGSLVAILAGYVFLPRLGVSPMQGTDEGLYAVAARNMVLYDRWLVPSHLVTASGAEWSTFVKMPPLFTWTSAVSMHIFGINTFAARLPAALATVATAVVIYIWGKREHSIDAGVLSASIFIATPYVYGGSHSGRQATVDPLFVLLGTIFIASTWYGFHNGIRRGRIVAGVLGGLLLLTKGLGAGIYALVALPIVLTHRKYIIDRTFIIASAFGIGIVGVWLVPVAAQLGVDYAIQQIVVYQLVDRISGNLATYGGTFYFMKFPYISTAPTFFGPWLYVLLAAAPVSVYALSERIDWFAAFLSFWCIFVFCFFLLTGNHPWYLMPAFVPAALIVGRALSAALAGQRKAGGAIISGILLALVLSPRSLSPVAAPLMRIWGHEPGAGFVFTITLILIAGVVALSQLRAFSRSRQTIGAVGLACLIVVALAGPTVIVGDPFDSREEFAVESSNVIEDEQVYSVIANGTPAQWRALSVEFHLSPDIRIRSAESIQQVPANEYVLVFGNAPSRGTVLLNTSSGNLQMQLRKV